MDSSVWEKEVATWCPGAGKGRLYSAGEIEEILAKKKEVSGCKKVTPCEIEEKLLLQNTLP
jgi:hypothetical protein